VTREEIIAEVAKRHGVLLSPDDPVLIEATMLEMVARDIHARDDEVLALPDEVSLRINPMLAEMKAVREDMKAHARAAAFTDDQVHALGRHLVMACSGWAPRVIKATERRTIAILAAAGVAVLLLGMAISHWGIDGNMRGMQCGYSQTGQWMCWAPTPKR
jgi:hypothetical protein